MITNDVNSLLSALEAWRGIICLVGKGDTEALLYHLAMLHPGLVGITATTPISSFPNQISAYQIITEEKLLPTLVRTAAETYRLVAYAQPSIKKGLLAGVSPSLIGVTHRQGRFDVTLVKGNTGHSHWPQASTEMESIIPEETSTVILMLSAPALGQFPSQKIAHRKLASLENSNILKPDYLAQLLASPTGGLKRAGKAKIIPLINMADEPVWKTQGIAIAETTLLQTEQFDRVVLTCMNRANPLVRVIRRSELHS